MTAMEQSLFAYALREQERGWSWRIYDRDGEIVAAGEALSKSLAEGEVKHACARCCQAPAAPGSGH